MSFGQPLFFIALILVPLLWLFLRWAAGSRARAVARLGELGLVDKLAESLNARGRRWQQRLWLLALALIVIALARPQWGTDTQVVQQEGIQVMVALDISASMLAQDLQPDRLTRAKQTMAELMDSLNGDQIGLVLFSGASFIQFPLTNDYATAKSFLDTANPGMISRPGTAIGQAIRTAIQGFDDTRSSQRVIVIMTDGENHEGDVQAAAEGAAADAVIIYTIGFGSPEGEPVPVFDPFGNVAGYKSDASGQVILSRLDEVTLQQIARLTNGDYYRASPSGAEIDRLVDELARLESAELETRFEVQAVERFPIFLFIAIVLLGIAEFIPERRRRARRSFEQLVGMLVASLLVAGGLGGCAGVREAQLVAQGNQQFEQSEYEQALATYTEARTEALDVPEPIYNSANTQFRQSLYPEAALTMEEALVLSEGELSAEAYFNLGNTYFVQEQWEQAVEAYKESLRLNPDDIDAKYNLELALNQIEQEQSDSQSEEQQEEDQSESAESEQEDSGQSEQEQEDESGGQEEQQEEQEAEPTPDPESENDEDASEDEEQQDEDSGGDNEQQEDAQPQPENANEQGEEQADPNAATQGELTEEQAIQLLDAVEQGAETLQERLQQIFTVPGPPPDKDY